jgi:hypothetical protein
LYLLAPIPVLIVALGWDHRSGLVAAVVGGLALSAFTASSISGLAFVVINGLPAWWLAYLALLGRPAADGVMEWYPVGRLLAWVAATAALTMVAAGVISSDGDYGDFLTRSRQVAETFASLFLEFPQQGGADQQREAVIETIAKVIPALSTFGFTLFLASYLWLAAKVVAVSKRLPRPWPPMPELAMPRSVLGALLLALVLVQFGGFIGALGYSLCGAFFMAFTFQGLARIHDRTRGKQGRAFLLAGLYVLLLLTQGIMIVALSLFGLADTIFGFRRIGAKPKPPTLST